MHQSATPPCTHVSCFKMLDWLRHVFQKMAVANHPRRTCSSTTVSPAVQLVLSYSVLCHRLSSHSSPLKTWKSCPINTINPAHQSSSSALRCLALQTFRSLALSSHMRLHNQSSPIILGLGNHFLSQSVQLVLEIERFPSNALIETTFSSCPLPCKRVMSLPFFCSDENPISFLFLLSALGETLSLPPARESFYLSFPIMLNPMPKNTCGYEHREPPLSASRVFNTTFRHVRYSSAILNDCTIVPTHSAVPYMPSYHAFNIDFYLFA